MSALAQAAGSRSATGRTRNGQATMNDGGTFAPELALLAALNLPNAAWLEVR
jgi:hypothetical protein